MSSLSGAGDTPLGEMVPPLSKLMLFVSWSTLVGVVGPKMTGGSGDSGLGGIRLHCRDRDIFKLLDMGDVAVAGGSPGTEIDMVAGLFRRATWSPRREEPLAERWWSCPAGVAAAEEEGVRWPPRESTSSSSSEWLTESCFQKIYIHIKLAAIE